MKSIVYIATNAVSRNIYIGITRGYLSQRKSKHLYSAFTLKVNTIFGKAIRKYGWDVFDFREVARFETYEEAQAEEARLIVELKPKYNQTAGGGGSYGFKHTAEARRKMSESQKGRPGYWKGKKMPPHVVEAMRANRPAITPEITAMGQQARRRPVICVNDGKRYESCAEAAKAYGAEASAVTAVCRDTVATAKGRVFKYADDSKIVDVEARRRAASERKARPGQSRKARTVICLDDGKTYPSIIRAAAAYAVGKTIVWRSCNGKNVITGPRFGYSGG